MARREGEAFIEVHADTSPFAREAEAGVRRGSEAAEDDLGRVGDKWGEVLTDSMGKRLTKEGPALAKSVEKGLEKEIVNVPITPRVDRRTTRRAVRTIVDEIEDAVSNVAAGGGDTTGPFGKLGTAFADAIGAGFNVSGRSPLIVLLIPVIGAIVGLVIAAIQAVNALVAVLLTLPGIFASIGFQVGVLMVAFEGVGTAIQGAFAATNAKELKLALQGLTPAAQDFVKSLLPLKGFFASLKASTQESFFKAFGDDLIPQLLATQGGRIFNGFRSVADSLGTFFKDLGFFFNSDTFSKFLDEVFPRIVSFLELFGPSFINFIEGLINIANATMPFMTEVGGIISMIFKQLGDFLTETASDPAFQEWLVDMRNTLDEVVTLIKVAFVFIGQLMDSISQAGGDEVITQISMSLALIGDFLASPVGISAMKAFINIAIQSIQIITGLVIAILAIAGAAQKVWDYISQNLFSDIGSFFVWLGGRITAFWDKVVQVFNDFVSKASQAPGMIRDKFLAFFSGAKTWLLQAGRNIIQGLIDGIKGMFGSLWEAMKQGAGIIAGFIPHSPAEEGPLSGKGDPLYSGQEIVKRLVAGIDMQAPELREASSNAVSNVFFGANSIQVRAEGMAPSQAREAGANVAQGIFGSLAIRNTKLAVRTL